MKTTKAKEVIQTIIFFIFLFGIIGLIVIFNAKTEKATIKMSQDTYTQIESLNEQVYELKRDLANTMNVLRVEYCTLGFNNARYYWSNNIPLEQNSNYDYMKVYCKEAVQSSRCEFCKLIK